MIKIQRVTVSNVVSFFIPLGYKICYNSGDGNGTNMKLLTHTEPNKRNATTSRKYYDDVMKASDDVKFKVRQNNIKHAMLHNLKAFIMIKLKREFEIFGKA